MNNLSLSLLVGAGVAVGVACCFLEDKKMCKRGQGGQSGSVELLVPGQTVVAAVGADDNKEAPRRARQALLYSWYKTGHICKKRCDTFSKNKSNYCSTVAPCC